MFHKSRERQPFFLFFFFFPPFYVSTLVATPPVLAGTRFENSGLFKGNYRFYFRSARQFEFLIRKERGSGWVVLGNCAIRTRIREFDFRGILSRRIFSAFFLYRGEWRISCFPGWMLCIIGCTKNLSCSFSII